MHNHKRFFALICVLLCAIMLTGFSGATALAAKDTAQSALAKAQKLFDSGDYYKSALALRDCLEEFPETEDECEELFDEIAEKCKNKQPKTGELERNFPYYGKNCVRATAVTAPFEMTITDVDNKGQYVRFFVRQYETSEIYLPSGHYYVNIKMGDIWFNNAVGFGEFCESSDFGGDTLDMTSREKNNTLTYHEWSPTF